MNLIKTFKKGMALIYKAEDLSVWESKSRTLKVAQKMLTVIQKNLF